MVDQAEMKPTNGHTELPPRAVAREPAEFLHDLTILAELQAKLLVVDCRQGMHQVDSSHSGSRGWNSTGSGLRAGRAGRLDFDAHGNDRPFTSPIVWHCAAGRRGAGRSGDRSRDLVATPRPGRVRSILPRISAQLRVG